VGLGTELLLVLLLGFLILGPKQMHALLARAAPVKAEFDKATRSFKSHLTAKPEIPSPTRETPSAKAVDVAARTASISPTKLVATPSRWDKPCSSRTAAACDSPARQCREARVEQIESALADSTSFAATKAPNPTDQSTSLFHMKFHI